MISLINIKKYIIKHIIKNQNKALKKIIKIKNKK